ncbi:hypothetical protein HDU85_004593 [Gaertneriomyces sp. JEL0708]|nr:hypothetical protein HDU85_004593 [Gaertneriomyces sp. JEL0708]
MKICQACRRPIQGRSVTALGKQYHLEHFVCSKCEKPFNSSVYWELKGKPYCEIHFHELLGELCGLCCEPISGSTIQAMSRKWCEKHFMCMACLSPLIGQGTSGQFVEWDCKPFCKKCFEKLPAQVRNRVGKEVEREKKIAAAVKA